MAESRHQNTGNLTGANNSDSFDPSDIRRLPVLLHQAREALSTEFRPIFLIHDITDPQWRVLRILLNSPGIDTTSLANRSHLLGPSLSRIIRDLSQRGLIERRADPADARRSFHLLTEEGERVIEEVSPYFAPIYDGLLARLGADEVARINSALETLLAALDRTAENGEP